MYLHSSIICLHILSDWTREARYAEKGWGKQEGQRHEREGPIQKPQKVKRNCLNMKHFENLFSKSTIKQFFQFCPDERQGHHPHGEGRRLSGKENAACHTLPGVNSVQLQLVHHHHWCSCPPNHWSRWWSQKYQGEPHRNQLFKTLHGLLNTWKYAQWFIVHKNLDNKKLKVFLHTYSDTVVEVKKVESVNEVKEASPEKPQKKEEPLRSRDKERDIRRERPHHRSRSHSRSRRRRSRSR